MRLLALFIALALPASVLAQGKSEPVRIDTGSDLLWKKLEARVAETADRIDGVMGVAILDLTDGRILCTMRIAYFPPRAQSKSRFCSNYIVRIRKLTRELKRSPNWMTTTRSIPKTWSKIAGSWLVLLQVSHESPIATWLNSWLR